MAEELGSKLGFDVSQAVASLSKLKRELESYSASLVQTAGSTDKFNKEQSQVDNLLVGGAAAAERAAKGLAQFAKSQLDTLKGGQNLSQQLDKLIGQFNRLSVAQSKNAASAGKTGLPGAGPLSGFVDARNQKINAAAEQVQTLALQAGSKAIQERIRFTQVLADAEKRRNTLSRQATESSLRDAFRGPREPPTRGVASASGEDSNKFLANIRRMSDGWQGLVKIFATQIVFNALGNVIRQLEEGVRAASDFEIQLAQIQTISGEFTAQGLDATADAVERLSNRFGQPIEDVAAGLYEALSNQIGDATDATLFLNEALEFSKASVTSAADSVDVLSGVINSYGLTAASAGAISDQLFVLIDRGRVKGEELANTVGRILPLAKSLGINFAEVSAAVAELTIQGVKTNDAFTQITNVMLKLLKPTEALKAVFNELGIANAEAGIALFGFDGFLREVTKNAKGSASEIAELFNQVRGTRGVIGIVTRDTATYAETLREIENASSGAGRAQEAAEKILATNAAQLQRSLTELRNFLVNDIGRTALEVLNNLSTAVGGVKNAFIAFASVVAGVGLILGGAGVTVLIGQAVSALGVLSKALGITTLATEAASAAAARYIAIWGGVVAIALAAGALTAALASQTNQANILSAALEKNRTIAEQSIDANIKGVTEELNVRKKAVKEAVKATVEQFRQYELAYQKDREAAFRNQADITRQLEDQLSRRKSLISQALSAFEQIQKDSAKRATELNKSTLDTQFQQNANRFERDIENVTNPETLANALLARSNKVLDAAKKAFAEGNTEFGEELFQESLDLANRVADIDTQRQRGEGQINRLLQEQKTINAELLRQEEQKAANAAAAEKATRAQLLRTSSQIDELNAINAKINKDQPVGPALAELLQQREALAAEIQTGLFSLNPGDLSSLKNLRDIFAELRSPFQDATTGGVNSLTTTVANAGRDLINTLQRQANAAPLEIRVKFKALTGEELGTEGFGAAQTQAALIGGQLDANIENEKQLEVFEGRITNATRNIQAATTSLGQSITDTAKQAARFDLFGVLGEGAVPAEQRLTAQANNINAQLNEIISVAQRAAQSGDIPLLEQQLRKLDEIGKVGEGGSGFSKFGEQIQNFFGGAGGATNIKASVDVLRTSLTELAKAQAGLVEGTQTAALSGALEQALVANNTQALAFLQTLNTEKQAVSELAASTTTVATASTDAVATANQQFSQFTTQPAQAQIDALIAKYAQLQQAAQQANTAGATQGRARGGLVHYYANGGFVPRGTDTVPAMLSPGEIVMNAKASRSFYSELMAMNRGVHPVYRAEGGPVSNVTTVGDININIPSQRSGRVNGRELARELRRELRRGTIRRL